MTEYGTRAEREGLRAFFMDRAEDTLVNACLQGHTGRAAGNGDWAVLLAGDFAFLAGTPRREALDWLDAEKRGLLILSGGEKWLALAAAYPRAAERGVRYGFSQPKSWDADRLHALARNVPEGVEIRPMDGVLFSQCRGEEQLYDLCSAFEDMADFAAHGAGVLAVKDGRVLAGASTYAWEDGGIEVEIDTLPPYRRQGLATACGAALILDCLKKGLRPHWDAANETSLRLARRLGYPEPQEYEVLEWQ